MNLFNRIFWRHRWKHPDNGNPYRRRCTVCGEQQEWGNEVEYDTGSLGYRWTVWNAGDHTKHWYTPAKRDVAGDFRAEEK